MKKDPLDKIYLTGTYGAGKFTLLCGSRWQKLFSKVSHADMVKLRSGQLVGVCHDILNLYHHNVLNSNTINYMAGYIVTNGNQGRKWSLDLLKIEEAVFAVLELEGSVMDCIYNGFK